MKSDMKKELEISVLESWIAHIKFMYDEAIKELDAAHKVEEEQNELIDALIAKIDYLEDKLSAYRDSERCDKCDEMFRRFIVRRL